MNQKYPILETSPSTNFVSVADEPNEEFFKSAMQKQKNAIFIHIWWVAPDINSHMSQRHPPAIIRPISQKALLKKMAPT